MPQRWLWLRHARETPPEVFISALRAEHGDARANAAWALGMLHVPARLLMPLLQDKDADVLQATLLALGRAPGDVSAEALLPFLSNDDPRVRGAAAVALARHQPELAIRVIPAQLRKEIAAEKVLYDLHVKSGTPQTFTQPEIHAITDSFKCQMELVRAISILTSNEATRELASIAFRPDKSFSQSDGMVAGFQLWDRIGADTNISDAGARIQRSASCRSRRVDPGEGGSGSSSGCAHRPPK